MEFSFEASESTHPVLFRMSYDKYSESWSIWHRDEKQQKDYVGGFYGFPPASSDVEATMHSSRYKSDEMYSIRVGTVDGHFTFKFVFDYQTSGWTIWLQDEVRGKTFIADWKEFPPVWKPKPN